MKLIVGLGNPGEEYQNTRHNVGYMVIDKLKTQSANWRTKVKDIVFVKTNVFMNDSGEAVKVQSSKFKVQSSDLYIVHDDLDIPLGQFKIQKARGPKDHNGINSIEEELGTNEFWRVRMGIENRDRDRVAGEEYVLQEFTPQERKVIDQAVVEVIKAVIDHAQSQN